MLMALVNDPTAQVVPCSEEIGKLVQYACSHTMTVYFPSVLSWQIKRTMGKTLTLEG